MGEGLCKPGLNYRTHLHKVRAVTPEDLIEGPRALGISFEFWENLVLRYLTSPNRHDLLLAKAIRSRAGGLTLEEFTRREILYLSLTSILKREEIRFFEECRSAYFEPYLEREWNFDQLYPSLRFSQPLYRLAHDRTEFYLFDDPQRSTESTRLVGESDCVYHKPKRFRHLHDPAETLTLDCCRGITSRRLPVHVDIAYHLAWIVEYANACERCQEEADEVVREFAIKRLIGHHRPRFHPAYFQYERPQKNVLRDTRYIRFISNLKARVEDGSFHPAEGIVYEHRPTKAVIFASLIEAHILELKATLEKDQVKNDVVPLSPSHQPVYETASSSGAGMIEVSIGFLDDASPKLTEGPISVKIYNRRQIRIARNRVVSTIALRRSPRLRLNRQ